MKAIELKEQLLKGTYYLTMYGALIKLKVQNVVIKNDYMLTVEFGDNGFVDVFVNHMASIRRPTNLISDFKWCYVLRNTSDELLGWIGEINE